MFKANSLDFGRYHMHLIGRAAERNIGLGIWGERKYDSPTKACVRGYLKAQFLHVVKKPVNFASFTDNFTLLISKLLRLILNVNTANIAQVFRA